MPAEKNVALCGFMGSGKTAIGRELSNILGFDFMDMDEQIEKEAGLKIPEIFSRYGEAFFRNLEKKACTDLSAKSGYVISTGGGAVADAHNMEVIKKSARVVFIDTPFEVCMERIRRDINRPMASSRTDEELRALYDSRRESYEKSDLIYLADRKNAAECAKEIARLLKRGEKNNG